VAESVLVATVGGCQAPANTFQIVDHRDPRQVRRYQETFDDAFFDTDADGNVHVVLRRGPVADSGRPISDDRVRPLTQVIHLRTFWRPIPGRTVAERTQINGVVRYMLVGGGVGATFEGSGSLFVQTSDDGLTLKGSLEDSLLRPKRRIAEGSDLFVQADLKGTFVARRDPRRVVSIVNELDRAFDAANGKVEERSSKIK
jgi:hypothetical protein